jgi:hypothetical protein
MQEQDWRETKVEERRGTKVALNFELVAEESQDPLMREKKQHGRETKVGLNYELVARESREPLIAALPLELDIPGCRFRILVFLYVGRLLWPSPGLMCRNVLHICYRRIHELRGHRRSPTGEEDREESEEERW